jgi:FkbM family methyltransferase
VRLSSGVSQRRDIDTIVQKLQRMLLAPLRQLAISIHMTTLAQRFFSAAREARLIPAIQRRLKHAIYGEPDGFLQKCHGLIHVGANDGAERHLYAEHGLKVVWIEPIPEVFQQLVKNIRDFPDQRAINALITNEDDTLCTLHVSSNSGMSSSILDLHLHKDIWPQIEFTHDISLRSTRLPTALADIDLAQYDAMVLDTQGSELLILQSGATILGGFKYIQVAAANFEAYRNCATLDTITTFLRSHGFRLAHKTLTARRAAGGECFDVLFIHKDEASRNGSASTQATNRRHTAA